MVLQLLHKHIQDALVECVAVVFGDIIVVQSIGSLDFAAVDEIGRASCRERVCLSV